MKYDVIKDVSDHKELQNEITLELWPEFMLHDPVSNNNWSRLYELFPEYQFSLKSEGEIIGTGNCIPYYWDKSFDKLPEKGWDWVLKKGIEDRLAGRNPNTLNGLQITINKDYQGQGISSLVLKEMAELAKQKGFKNITIPIRPSLKSKYPLIPMDNYINWSREKDGLPFDPWIRVHKRFGGEVLKVCHEAMYIPGSVSEWEEWTNMKFKETAYYTIKGALRPVHIDIENDIGEYIEPNVWILHRV